MAKYVSTQKLFVNSYIASWFVATIVLMDIVMSRNHGIEKQIMEGNRGLWRDFFFQIAFDSNLVDCVLLLLLQNSERGLF